jgi:hypothetical protein
MFKKFLPLIAIAALLLSACGAAATPAPSFAPQAERSADNYASGAPAPGGTNGTTKGVSADTGNTSQVDRLVIKNANLEIVVEDPNKVSDFIAKLAEEMGGYVVSANMYQTYSTSGDGIPRGSISIRIPVEKLNEALTQIKGQSSQDVVNETISSEDVTSAYTDLQSRLRNSEAAEAELTRIMEEANKTEDVLNVYAQLKAVREEIELLKGQIQYYEQSAAYSLISVELVAEASIQPLEVGGWKPQGVARDAIQTLINTMQIFGSAAIWFVLFCAPVLLVLGIPLAILIAGIRLLTRKARKQVKRPVPLPPAGPHDAPVA